MVVFQHQNVVCGDRHDIGVVSGIDDRLALIGQLMHDACDFADICQIEVCCGLVEQDDVCFLGQRTSDSRQLVFASAEVGYRALDQMLQPNGFYGLERDASIFIRGKLKQRQVWRSAQQYIFQDIQLKRKAFGLGNDADQTFDI